VYNTTYPASGKSSKDKISFETFPLVQMVRSSKINMEYISEDDVVDAFSPVVVHEGLLRIFGIHECPNDLLNISGQVVVEENITRNKIALKYAKCYHQAKKNNTRNYFLI